MKNTISLVLVLTLGVASVGLTADGIWTQKADMPTGRLWHASSVVDGKIYTIGGRPTGALTSEYEPLTDTWTSKTPMPTARFAHSTSVVDGKIYAIGGAAAAYTPPLSVVEEYDPLTDNWTTKAPMPTARCCLATSVVDGKIYAIGGTGSSALWAGFHRTVEVYDPLTDTWSKKADMPTARIFFSTSVVDGKIYAIGGVLVTKAELSTVEVYDPVTDTWTTKSPMPTSRHAHASAVVDGKIYVIGGGADGGANPARPDGFSVVEAYDPAMDTWTTKAPMPAPRALLSASVVGGKIYAIGGKTSTKNPHPPGLSTVYEYDPFPLVVDFNGDYIVDCADICMMLDYWGTDETRFDIAPEPSGDGIVDIQDLILLAEHLFEEIYPVELLAYWKLDESEGDIAENAVSDNHGIVCGEPLWQPAGGIKNGALQFDGVDDCIVSDFVLNPADGEFSIFAWIKDGQAGQVVISQMESGNLLMADTQGGALMTELRAPGRFAQLLQSKTSITDGNWHRIGVVWDGSKRILYVDGIAVAEDTQDSIMGAENGLYIGTGKAMEAGTYWSGLIDDVRIYNRAVSP